MSDARGQRVMLDLSYAGDSGSFTDVAATKMTTMHAGRACVTFVLDALLSPVAQFLRGVPADVRTSEGEHWTVWVSDSGLTLATAAAQ